MSAESPSLVSPAVWRGQGAANANATLQAHSLSLHGQTVELRFPESIAADIRFLFAGRQGLTTIAQTCITVEEQEDGRYSLRTDAKELATDLSRVELPVWLIEEVAEALISQQKSALALHAGAVAWKGTPILIAGASGSGKSSLVAWLIDKGFGYLTDEIALLKESDRVIGFPRAVVIKSGAADKVQALSIFERLPLVKYGSSLVFSPAQAMASEAHLPCGMIVFPQYEPGAELWIKELTPAETGLGLVGCNLNARNFSDGGFGEIIKLSRQVPGISVRYGDFDQLENTLDALLRITVEKRISAMELRTLTSSLMSPAPVEAVSASGQQIFPIPEATPRRAAKPKLTIGMATYDDYDGTYFSVQAVRLYHPEILDQVEFVVIDNHPDGPCSVPLKALDSAMPNYRYIPQNTHRGTTVKNFVFEEAAGEFVLCMDCHVFVVPGALKRLIDYFEANEAPDLVQGPLIYDDLSNFSTHFRPDWRGGMYGCWESDERGKDAEGEPFDIPMQGMGLFACRKSAWPGFNPKFRGFGGEEGYIHEKFRQRGGRTLCLPFLRWMHRFNRPHGVPYPNIWEERIRNYVIGFRELGLDTKPVEEHFAALLGEKPAKVIFKDIYKELGV